MTLVVRGLIGLLGLAGVSSAIGLPLALKSEINNSDELGIASSGGGNSQISVEMCNFPLNNDGEGLEFGDQTPKTICWTSEGQAQQTNNSENYSKFFKDQWDKRTQSWQNEQNLWKKQCDGSESPWVIMPKDNNVDQYLGLCGASKSENTIFIKKRKEEEVSTNKEKWKLWICTNECWEKDTSTISGTTEVLDKEKTANWKSVTFSLKR